MSNVSSDQLITPTHAPPPAVAVIDLAASSQIGLPRRRTPDRASPPGRADGSRLVRTADRLAAAEKHVRPRARRPPAITLQSHGGEARSGPRARPDGTGRRASRAGWRGEHE